jgi:hypothetical protein
MERAPDLSIDARAQSEHDDGERISAARAAKRRFRELFTII